MTSCAGPTCRPITYQYGPNTLRMTQYSVALSTGTISGAYDLESQRQSAKAGWWQTLQYGDAQRATTAPTTLAELPAPTAVPSGRRPSATIRSATHQEVVGFLVPVTTQHQPYTLGGTSYDGMGTCSTDTFHVLHLGMRRASPSPATYGTFRIPTVYLTLSAHRVYRES